MSYHPGSESIDIHFHVDARKTLKCNNYLFCPKDQHQKPVKETPIQLIGTSDWLRNPCKTIRKKGWDFRFLQTQIIRILQKGNNRNKWTRGGERSELKMGHGWLDSCERQRMERKPL